jgi:hypothetical protein
MCKIGANAGGSVENLLFFKKNHSFCKFFLDKQKESGGFHE